MESEEPKMHADELATARERDTNLRVEALEFNPKALREFTSSDSYGSLVLLADAFLGGNRLWSGWMQISRKSFAGQKPADSNETRPARPTAMIEPPGLLIVYLLLSRCCDKVLASKPLAHFLVSRQVQFQFRSHLRNSRSRPF